jgi:hypothetical protein
VRAHDPRSKVSELGRSKFSLSLSYSLSLIFSPFPPPPLPPHTPLSLCPPHLPLSFPHNRVSELGGSKFPGKDAKHTWLVE